MVWRACQHLVEETPGRAVKVECRVPTSSADGRDYIRAAARSADIVVVAAPWWEADVGAAARLYPRTKFLVVGGRGGGGNVKALSFPAFEAGYLMGVAAAAAVPAGGYGFIGGREDDAARALASGYAAGVRAEGGGPSFNAVYLGRGLVASLDDEAAGREAAALFDRGAAVIFAAAGPANNKIAAVAKDKGKFIIGFESNQNYLERGHVITSLNIRWDDVVYEELKAAADGRFEGGVRAIPIASDLIAYPIDANNRALIPAAAVRKIEAARQELAALEGGA